MDNEESLHCLYLKMVKLKREVAAIENKKKAIECAKLTAKIDEKVTRFVDIVKEMNDYQCNINNKQTKIMYALQDKQSLLSDNTLHLTHSCHEDFINMLKSKMLLDKSLETMQTQKDQTDDLQSIVTQFRELHAACHNEFVERLCEFKFAKGLLDNIRELKEYDRKNNSILEQKSGVDSDLGCYPNDSTNSIITNSNPAETSEFATSSPISLIRSDHT